jgi:CBS domain-containing protein
MVAAARLEEFAAGALVLDAFAAADPDRRPELYLVVSGQVDVWNDEHHAGSAADERLGPGGLFGFSAMLTEQSLGPRVIAVQPVTVAVFPAGIAEPAFVTSQGARFLAEQASVARPRPAPDVYSLVDDLIVTPPLIVQPTDPVADVARLMSRHPGTCTCAAVACAEGGFGLITDAILRRRVIVDGLPGSTPAREVMDRSVPVVRLGDSAAEAQILMLDRDAEFLLVTDRNGQLRGVIAPRDFAVSPATAGVSLHEQMRRVASVTELQHRAAQVPPLLGDLLSRGLASGKVIAVYSTILDTIVRRALVLTFDRHPDLALDAFTWLSLGSNGRREAILSSDIDSAAAFDDQVSAPEIDRYRVAFAEVAHVLAECRLLADEHGATAQRPGFSRTNASWRAAAQEWLRSPEKNQGAVMTSLLVDGRPIHGDPGLPAATAVFSDLRSHPGTMRLLLEESLSHRARLRALFSWPETFDLKANALLPIVNIARWAALSVGSAALPTVDRLKTAGGSTMLPTEQAETLIEIFEVLQRLRLRYQIAQVRMGELPSDVLTRERMSPIDRSVVTQAVREITAVQKRMDRIAVYEPPRVWSVPEPS